MVVHFDQFGYYLVVYFRLLAGLALSLIVFFFDLLSLIVSRTHLVPPQLHKGPAQARAASAPPANDTATRPHQAAPSTGTVLERWRRPRGFGGGRKGSSSSQDTTVPGDRELWSCHGMAPFVARGSFSGSPRGQRRAREVH